MNLIKQLRLVLAGVGALLFAILAVWAMYPPIKKSNPRFAPPVSPYEESVAGSGLVEPSSQNLAIANPVSGVIETVFVKPQDHVKKGDPLFSLETRHLERDLETARTQVKVSQADAADACMKLELIEKVSDQRAVRAEERKSREFAVERTMAEVEHAEAEVARLEVEIERQTVRASIDGEILRVEARPGEYAPAQREDPPLVLMGDTSRLNVRAEFPEDLAWKITPSSKATASPRGRGDRIITLEYQRIEPYVRPKKSLTGDPDERVDTRIVQVIYSLPVGTKEVFDGEQMDVFISSHSTSALSSR